MAEMSMIDRVVASRKAFVSFKGERGGWYLCTAQEAQNEDREVVAGPFRTSAEADTEGERINARAAIEAALADQEA